MSRIHDNLRSDSALRPLGQEFGGESCFIPLNTEWKRKGLFIV